MILFLLILLDILLANLTPYTLHLIILGIPFVETFFPFAVYFLLLSLFDVRYLLHLALFFVLYKIDKKWDRALRTNLVTYTAKMVFFYLLYIVFFKIIEFVM